MKSPSLFSGVIVVRWMLAVILLGGPVTVSGADQSTNGPRHFASSADAIQALRQATAAGDRQEVHQIFGPAVKDFLTGDEVQDRANFKGFARAMSNQCVPVQESGDRIVLDIGTNSTPFPIPLVKQDSQWYFDTEAGREAIIDRHIGRDELNAIGVCRAYVTAQKQYHDREIDAKGLRRYAIKFKSTPGQHDGLYWPAGDESSPLGALVAAAHAEGYSSHPSGSGPHPFHGYLFRILTAQGFHAPGGKSSYLVDGNMVRGFALVAYPDRWGRSGIMTFIVGEDGKVYQRNLGPDTDKIAGKMAEYDPDRHWTLVEDQGYIGLDEKNE